MTRRRYGQFCGLAAALDLVGERWTLLVARDLLAGPARYSELAAKQPGVSSDQLTARLRHLEEHGLVARQHLPAPARGVVYALTADGETQLRPVIDALARFGVPRLPDPSTTDDRLDANWAFETVAAWVGRDAPPGGGLRIVTDTGVARLVLDGSRLHHDRDPVTPVDVELRGPTQTVLGVVMGHLPAEAVEVEGDLDRLQQWRQVIASSVPSPITVTPPA